MTEETARKANIPNLVTLVATGGNGDRGQPARQALCQSGAAFRFSTVVSDACSDELSSLEFATAMAKDGCRMGIMLERLPVGRAAKLGYGLSKTSRAVFRNRISSVERKSGLPLRFFPCEEADWGDCAAAGRDLLHINADGGVEPCPLIHETVEDLNHNTLANVLQSPILSSIRHTACHGSVDHPCSLLGSVTACTYDASS